MIRENKYFLLVRLANQEDNKTYILKSKIKVGMNAKAYLFDILIGALSEGLNSTILVATEDYFAIKYIQAFGAARERYFYFNKEFNSFNLDTYAIKNITFCDDLSNGKNFGISFRLSDALIYDTTLDALDISQDFQFNERFFAGMTGFATDQLSVSKKTVDGLYFKSKVGSISNKRISAKNFQGRGISDQFMNDLFQELMLLSTPVALAGGVNPFHFFDLNLQTGELKIDQVKSEILLSQEILDIGFLGQISSYQVKRILLVCGTLDPLFLKYGVRSNRFINLEAGAISHAISLYCAEMKTHCRIIGGFDDEVLSSHLRLKGQDVFPVVALFLGDMVE